MVTVLRQHGLRFMIYSDDHEPAHVHVFGDHEAKINLSGHDSLPELVWNKGLNAAELRRAMRAVAEHQVQLLARWKDIHG